MFHLVDTLAACTVVQYIQNAAKMLQRSPTAGVTCSTISFKSRVRFDLVYRIMLPYSYCAQHRLAAKGLSWYYALYRAERSFKGYLMSQISDDLGGECYNLQMNKQRPIMNRNQHEHYGHM